jgi:DNA (cytosine-5)-methyltransferase 1
MAARTYGDLLHDAWLAHLAPRAADAPTVVSTFAGCGGSSLGYGMAGFRELLAVEWDEHAVACFRRNFPDVPVHHGDIAHVDPADLGLAPGELDVFDGSPPCQGFSTTGRRQIDDPRNQLFREYVRLLEAWQPKVFVMENVSGMVKGRMKPLFAEILATLKAAGPGYRVAVRLLDASYLNVPQARKRVIFVGVRSDLPFEPVHPTPNRWQMTVRQGWEGLTDPGPFEMPRGKLANLAPLVPPGMNGPRALVPRGGAKSWFNTQRLAWDKPSFTVVKSLWPGMNALLHPVENRNVGLHELSRLQSFPDEYDWGQSSVVDAWARIGNSVPPLMMRAISQTIRDRILTPARQAGR